MIVAKSRGVVNQRGIPEKSWDKYLERKGRIHTFASLLKKGKKESKY